MKPTSYSSDEPPIVIKVTTGSAQRKIDKCCHSIGEQERKLTYPVLAAAVPGEIKSEGIVLCDKKTDIQNNVTSRHLDECNRFNLKPLSDEDLTVCEPYSFGMYVDGNLFLNSLKAEGYKFLSTDKILDDKYDENNGRLLKSREETDNQEVILQLDNAQIYRILDKSPNEGQDSLFHISHDDVNSKALDHSKLDQYVSSTCQSSLEIFSDCEGGLTDSGIVSNQNSSHERPSSEEKIFDRQSVINFSAFANYDVICKRKECKISKLFDSDEIYRGVVDKFKNHKNISDGLVVDSDKISKHKKLSSCDPLYNSNLKEKGNHTKIQCGACESWFSEKKNLEHHMWECSGYKRAIHLQKKVTCFVCNKIFDSLIDLQMHFSVVHCERPLNCILCKCSFSLPESLIKHWETCMMRRGKGFGEDEKPTDCESFKLFKCIKNYEKKGSCKDNIILSGFACKLCNRKFSNVGSFKKHIGLLRCKGIRKSLQQDREVNFSHCIKKLQQLSISNHLDSNAHAHRSLMCDYVKKPNPSLRIVCKWCKSVFSTIGMLRKHLVLHRCQMLSSSFMKKGKVTCPVCCLKFEDLYSFKMHISKSHGRVIKLAPISNQPYKRKLKFKNKDESMRADASLKYKHKQDCQEQIQLNRSNATTLDDRIICKGCGKAFKRVKYLKQHIKLNRCIFNKSKICQYFKFGTA